MGDSLREHPSVRAFVAAATRYCGLIESQPTDRDLWLAETLQAIAMLYAAAPVVRELGLPGGSRAIPSELRLSNEQWQTLFGHLRQILGKDAHYSSHFNPLTADPADEQTTIGDLADDLADIYRDLKPGLAAWSLSGNAYEEDILFQWVHYGHVHHWGRHAVDAMRALHWLVYK
jgi:hypothetical protein